MQKEKKLDFRIAWNKIYFHPNDLVGGCVFGLTFSFHPPDKTWLVVMHFIFFEISLGWVDKE